MSDKISTPHQAAVAAMGAGFSVLPPKQDGSKAPDASSWTEFQHRRADRDQIDDWYSNGRTGVGFVMGPVSGDAEALDFDDRSALAEFEKLVAEAGFEGLWERIKQGYFEHSPNGAHAIYRCSENGNEKLAKKPNPKPNGRHDKWKTTIETKGEGGYIIVAPTYGSVNNKGSYRLVSGGPGTIESITPEERAELHRIARMLDESIAPSEVPAERRAPDPANADKPGSDYNRRATWEQVLEPHGWTRVSRRLGVASWRRPGKDHGISATTNHAGSDLLYVFSTSTGFDAERGYSKFSAYAFLDHNGDFKEASKELALLGYGDRPEVQSREVDLSGIMARWDQPEDRTPDLQQLLRVPGLVGELAEWIDNSSVKPQPVLALGAAIATVGSILGRKVMTKTELRTNMYVLGVGETGCGKERARQAIKRLYSEAGIKRVIGESFASDSAVEAAITVNPVRLYLIDELGHFLGTMRNQQTPTYVRSILPVLLRMYSASEGMYVRRTYADTGQDDDDAEDTVDQPCLSIYGTTVPNNLYKGLTKENASDGFLSRLLVFDSEDPDPHVRVTEPGAREPPKSLVKAFRQWHEMKPKDEGDIECRPMIVDATKDAWAAFDELESRMRRKRKQVREAGEDQGPYTRVWATAQKLALIRACGIEREVLEITESDARWGCDLALVLTEKFMARVGENVVENRTEETCNRILEIVRKAGLAGIQKNRVTHQTRWAKVAERKEALLTLEEAGQIRSEEVSTGGRKATRYFAV